MNQLVDHRTAPELAAKLGVVDGLLFRRLSSSVWAHLGGFGRGRGWAGIVQVDGEVDPLATRMPPRPGEVAFFDHAAASRVLGPYYARSGALVRVSSDALVILGHPSEQVLSFDTDLYRTLAELVDVDVDDVAPSKRLADELEVLHAVREVSTAPVANLHVTLEHVLHAALTSLSCDVGVLRDANAHVVTANAAGGPSAGDPLAIDLVAHLDELEALAAEKMLCIQDVSMSAVRSWSGVQSDLRSVMVIRMPQPLGGLMVLAHTAAGPRGFTSLCQRLAQHVVDAGSVIAHTAATRDQLTLIADQHFATARVDTLTGLGNRLCWDEGVAHAQNQVDAGASATVITLDLDGLKAVNDTHGHGAGDDLLRRCADILRRHCRSGDLAVRLGGDEFALLLPIDRAAAADRVAAITRDLAAATSGRDAVAASVGAHTAGPAERVADAMRDADAAMYQHKRARRTQRPERSAQPAAHPEGHLDEPRLAQLRHQHDSA